MEKLTQTIETLGLPFVGYKMQSEKVEQHLHERAVAEQYGILPSAFFQLRTDEDKFKERVERGFMDVINAALKKKKVQWKVYKLDVCQSDRILSAGRYIFHGTSDYGEVREVMNSLDWDAIALSVQQEVDGYDELEDGNDTTAWVELKAELYGHPLDERWVNLWSHEDEFDQVFWSAYEKTDIMQWRGYAVQHNLTTNAKTPRALDFICWAMMTQDYDEFMAFINDNKQVTAKTGIDLFASINTNTTPQTTTSTPIKESGNSTTMAQTTTPQTALTAQTPVTEAEQQKFFKGALAIPQIAASEKVWARTGSTFETIVLFAKDVDAYFTCDSKIVKTTGKPSNKKYQWILVDNEKFSWNNIGDATKGFEAYAKDDYAGMAKYMTEPSAKRWMAMLNGEEEAETPQTTPAPAPQKEEPKAETSKVEQPKAEAPKTTPQFKGVTYNDPTGDGIYHLVWVSSDKCHIYGINGNGFVEVDMVLDKANTERCIAQASLQQIDTPKKFYDALRKLKLEVAPTPAPKAKEEPKTEAPKVVKTLDSKPQPKKEEQPKVEEPKAEAPKVEQTLAPKADRVTIDKRDGGLFIGGADADIEMLIRSYVDAINAMQMRKIG